MCVPVTTPKTVIENRVYMVVGVLSIDLVVHESSSLKVKRQVIKRIIEKTRSKFNASIAEVEDQNLWQKARLGICVVGNDRRFVNSVLDKIINFIERINLAEVVDSRIEIVNF